MLKITPDVFAKSLYYIGPGYDIEPLLRFTHLTDTFIYTNLFLSLKEVTGWYEKQFALHPDIEVLARDICRDFDETRYFDLHPEYISHLMQPMFLEQKELDDYLAAFEHARKLCQWAVTYRLRRISSGRELTLLYLTAEGLASYIVLSHNGRYAPKILTTIRTNVLEDPRGMMNRFLKHEVVRKPTLWVRGFMPEPPVYTDLFSQEVSRQENEVLKPVGVFSATALSFNHKWICGNFDHYDPTNSRHCKGFVTGHCARLLRQASSTEKLTKDGTHQLVFCDIFTKIRSFTDQNVLVLSKRLRDQAGTIPCPVITWESILPLKDDFLARRTAYYPPAAEQLKILWRILKKKNLAHHGTIHLIPFCLEDEGRQYREAITSWPVKTITYVRDLLDFIDLRQETTIRRAHAATAIYKRTCIYST